VAAAGLPHASPDVEQSLRATGVDPDRLSIVQLGHYSHLDRMPPWFLRITAGFGLLLLGKLTEPHLPEAAGAVMSLVISFVILQSTCELLIVATERLAARLKWNHYTAGTIAEILSTMPELVVIGFVIGVSPIAAFVITIITIYNNALVFSRYSFFLPKDAQGKFMMPKPITEAGTQILVGGGAMGLILGLVMLTFTASGEGKNSFTAVDLIFCQFDSARNFRRLYVQATDELRAGGSRGSGDIGDVGC